MYLRSSNAYELTGNPASSRGSAFADSPRDRTRQSGRDQANGARPACFP